METERINGMKECIVCGSPYVEIHHIFHGTGRRQISDKYGYVVPLCRRHHTGPEGVHFNRAFDLELMRKAQDHFESHYGTREDFIKVFGKSYL